MNILVIQSSLSDPVGVFGEHLIRQGATLSVWSTEQQAAPPKEFSEKTYDALVILGGSMNAHEDEKFPHLRATVELIQKFYREHKPIVGICLGAQLIARAFGSQVSAHRVPEIGFCAVRPVEDASSDPVLKGLFKDTSNELCLMQWHFDTFDLPPAATLLMTNDVCRHQAYRIGETIYAFQFHFEVTPNIVLGWLAEESDWLEAAYPGRAEQIKQQLEHYYSKSADFAAHIAESWLKLASAAAL